MTQTTQMNQVTTPDDDDDEIEYDDTWYPETGVILEILPFALMVLVAGVSSSLLQYKPELNLAAEENPTISELMLIYPDVRAWLTLVDTNVDYPVVQSTDNQTYVNKDIDGSFSLSGAIFLDWVNAGDFSDDYNILLFILTEDMTMPMIIIDRWTLAMVLIFLVQVFVAIQSRKKDEAPKEDREET